MKRCSKCGCELPRAGWCNDCKAIAMRVRRARIRLLGEKAASSLTDDDLRLIRALRGDLPMADIAEKFERHQSTVYAALKSA